MVPQGRATSTLFPSTHLYITTGSGSAQEIAGGCAVRGRRLVVLVSLG